MKKNSVKAGKISDKMDYLSSLYNLSKAGNIDRLELLALSFRLSIEAGEKSGKQ